jgi:hypothetical protein
VADKEIFLIFLHAKINFLKELTTLMQLDAVLSSLNNHRAEKYFMFKDIAELVLVEHSNIPFGDILSILKKLHNDGYLEYDDRGVDPFDRNANARIYHITFEGRFWVESGGYQADFLHENAENTRLEKIEKSQKLYRLWTIWLTAILAVGTLIAALYYATELYWNHGWFHFR